MGGTDMADWFVSSQPVLSQFGATIGRGLSSSGGGSSSSQQSTSRQEEDLNNQLAEQKRQADRDYGLKKRELDQQYQISQQNARTAKERNEIDKWYNQQQVQLAQQRLSEEGRQFDQRLAFDKQTQAENLGLNQAKLGYDVLGMQAQLRGPQDYFQASELARGVAAQPGTATFLNALKNNAHLVGYGEQAGIPDKVSVNSLAAKLGGPQIIPGTGAAAASTSGGGPLSNEDANLGAIRNLYAAGAHKLGAGSLERLTDTELKLLQSGIGASGGDLGTFMDQYRRSRIGQNVGNMRAA